MSFPKYPAYKDSGVEWIGEIPVGWIISPLRYLAHCLDGKRIPLNKEERSYKKGDIPYWGANCIVDFVDEFLFNQELILLGEDGAPFFDKTKEVSFYINEPIWPNNHVHVLKVFENFSPKFLVYSLNCVEYSSYIEGSTRDKLTQNNMNRIVVPIPPLPEQQAIASFLDRECGKIDALIAEQERLIALLAEKRQAVISHAVTKGLNPNAPMKDSGIPWIGMVPEGWEVSRLKYLVQYYDGIQMGPFGGMLLDINSAPTGYKVYGQENTISGDFGLGHRWISTDRYNDLRRYSLNDGDLVLTRKGSLGNARLVSKLPYPGIADSDTIRIRVDKSKVYPEFLATLLHEANYIESQINASKRGAILSGLNTKNISDLIVIYPPIYEQNNILNYLKIKSKEFDFSIQQSAIAITLLKERRAALISAAVTGKIDVRAQNKALAA